MNSSASAVLSDPVNFTFSSKTTENWEKPAIFWIEGVATPIISICGLIGRIDGVATLIISICGGIARIDEWQND